MWKDGEAGRFLFLPGVKKLCFEDAAKVRACIGHLQQYLVLLGVQFGACDLNFRFLHLLLGQQIDCMWQLQSDVHSLSRTERKSGKIRIDYEPGRGLIRAGLVKDVVSLLRLDAEAGG